VIEKNISFRKTTLQNAVKLLSMGGVKSGPRRDTQLLLLVRGLLISRGEEEGIEPMSAEGDEALAQSEFGER